jgi:hypothetical protein
MLTKFYKTFSLNRSFATLSCSKLILNAEKVAKISTKPVQKTKSTKIADVESDDTEELTSDDGITLN